MAKTYVLFLISFALFQLTLQNVNNNEIDEDVNPFAEAASAFFQGDNVNQVGGILSSFMQSEGGKQIGDMLVGVAQNNNVATAQILQGLGKLMSQNTAKGNGNGGAAGGIDPAIIGSVLSMLGNTQKSKESDGFDIGSIISTVAGMFSLDGAENILGYMPTILDTLGSFVGSEAEHRALEHEDHAWLLPPILEKIHLMFDHFLHSDFGKSLMEKFGAEKFVKIFSDETGKFSYQKFVELLENQSFRKHWISMVTSRIADFISYFADPYTQKKFMTTVQFFINNFLKGQGIPKAALFDPTRPTESISSLVNHLSKKFFNYKVDAKKYVKPAVTYVQDIFQLAEEKGILGRAVDSEKLSNKLTDTINLEIIEPVARVNRAFRFASKVPRCDRYVMCLVNQESQDEPVSLPGLKSGLYRGASLLASWFLSTRTGTSFWSLYHVIMEENNCQARYLDECHDFHIEEIKATTEYVHNEL